MDPMQENNDTGEPPYKKRLLDVSQLNGDAVERNTEISESDDDESLSSASEDEDGSLDDASLSSEDEDRSLSNEDEAADDKDDESLSNEDEATDDNDDESLTSQDGSDEDIEEDEASANSEDENLPSDTDKYFQHFNYNFPEQVGSEKLKYESKRIAWPEVGKFVFMKPVLENTSCKEPSVKKTDIAEFQLKKNLLDSILRTKLKKMSKMQIGIYNLVMDYFDVLFMKRTHENGEKLRFIYTLHILNHILKSRSKVIHHNSKIKKNPEEEYRDQGFTRPISLILVPFRHDCHRIITHLTSLLPGCAVMNRKRFEVEYGPPPPPPRERMKKKPQDYDETFEGNTNEDFKIGLKIMNKTVTLFSEFYSSDLIIASPLGLRQIIGAEGDKSRDYDFLSSVEVLVIDRADVLMLQNPVHLLHVLKHLNLLPKESHDCNFFRVREYALNGMSKYYRQNILFSSVEHMFFEALIFRNNCFNYSGYLISGTDVKSPAIQNILVPMKMCFRWFDTETLETEIEDRFNFFVNKVLPDYKDKAMLQTLVYIPSYFDFVRLRNYFRENELSSVMVCEYSKKGKIAQARDVFFKGHRHFMLYTERAHFYSRYHIKGIQHIVFYQPPTYPGFFRELCNTLMDSNPRRMFEEKSCCVLASKHDLLQLKHIVGSSETRHMFNSNKKIFVKYTNQ